MAEYIIRETSYLMGTKKEVIGELIRCHECKHWEQEGCIDGYCHETGLHGIDEDHYCGFSER